MMSQRSIVSIMSFATLTWGGSLGWAQTSLSCYATLNDSTFLQLPLSYNLKHLAKKPSLLKALKEQFALIDRDSLSQDLRKKINRLPPLEILYANSKYDQGGRSQQTPISPRKFDGLIYQSNAWVLEYNFLNPKNKLGDLVFGETSSASLQNHRLLALQMEEKIPAIETWLSRNGQTKTLPRPSLPQVVKNLIETIELYKKVSALYQWPTYQRLESHMPSLLAGVRVQLYFLGHEVLANLSIAEKIKYRQAVSDLENQLESLVVIRPEQLLETLFKFENH